LHAQKVNVMFALQTILHLSIPKKYLAKPHS
jgi:hypothetical protein